MSTYLDEIAGRIRSHVRPEDLPAGDTAELFRLYAVLLLAKGASTSPADVHNAWVAWMANRRSEHPALLPFDELDNDTQRADLPFVAAIRQVAIGQ